MTEPKKPRARTAASHKKDARPAAKTKPWDKENPKKSAASKTKLTPAQKEEARARAEKAGRPYPNLVDNMFVARKAAKSQKD
ncbi:MAG: hypothetical protein DI551_07605 [Micavibrio aeruginosavorus]|uniref:Uncharacterized protein n=1 Tax=Micavibrio aeruginosavorus TaxID=349221 RepID=A0A2W5MVV6_9BACT|nr:MAG: hypothetical protein DI551_07605 [Micavibrio aeruginosavorus]